jgi:type II secretory pathway pseudopilin PulG
MSLMTNKKNRGDTLVEVLFATAVFSLVAVSCLSIMNQGSATAQRALEITLVRNEIDAQAETLRFLNASYISAYPNTSSGPSNQWQLMQDDITNNSVSQFGTNGASCPNIPNGSFILNSRKALYIKPVGANAPSSAVSFSQLQYDNASDNITDTQGIWIEAVKVWTVGNNNIQDRVGYIDFHIRACWDSPGQSVPVTLGTIVRLYEPHT